jgi:hypothetical protein
MWNIYDQATYVTYPDYKSGYWQKKAAPDYFDAYEHFTQAFGGFLDTINNWGNGDRMAGLLQCGGSLYLLRVHNGGKDGNGRPARWVLYLRRQEVSEKETVDIAAWLADENWPAPNPVPLPPKLPEKEYTAPLRTAPAAPQNTREENQTAPATYTEPKCSESVPHDASALQTYWEKWVFSPCREEKGWLIFADVGEKFASENNLKYKPSPTPVSEEEPSAAVHPARKKKKMRTSEKIRLALFVLFFALLFGFGIFCVVHSLMNALPSAVSRHLVKRKQISSPPPESPNDAAGEKQEPKQPPPQINNNAETP